MLQEENTLFTPIYKLEREQYYYLIAHNMFQARKKNESREKIQDSQI